MRRAQEHAETHRDADSNSYWGTRPMERTLNVKAPISYCKSRLLGTDIRCAKRSSGDMGSERDRMEATLLRYTRTHRTEIPSSQSMLLHWATADTF